MKKHILILSVMVLLASMMLAQETKLSGEFWSRWTMEQGQNPATGDDEILKNYFALERGYLGLETKFSESTKARFTVDIFSTDLIGDGAGLKIEVWLRGFCQSDPNSRYDD